MNFLIRPLRQTVSASNRYFTTTSRYAFQSSQRLRVGKESDLHKDDDVRAAEVQKTKDIQVEKQKQGKGEWHAPLASDSEEAVKADRNEIGKEGNSIEQLQQETVEKHEKAKGS